MNASTVSVRATLTADQKAQVIAALADWNVTFDDDGDSLNFTVALADLQAILTAAITAARAAGLGGTFITEPLPAL